MSTQPTTDSFSLPPLPPSPDRSTPVPLERLQVTDGLLLTADRWRVAHEYHRQRQNIHYQALHQPGIVSGLNVHRVAAPREFAAQYRDERWLRITPGVAIDQLGNPIIVPKAIEYRLASEPPASGITTIYLVLSYVDPDRLQRSTTLEVVQETFRIDEKTTPPSELEVELCRVLIQSGSLSLEDATEVFFPGVNQLDLRYRQQASARPHGQIQVAQLEPQTTEEQRVSDRLTDLLQSLPALYPDLAGDTVTSLILDDRTQVFQQHLLYLPIARLPSLKDSELETLKHYLTIGGVILFNVNDEETNIDELSAVKQEIQKTLQKLTIEDGSASLQATYQSAQTELEAELAEVDRCIAEQINLILAPIKQFAADIDVSVDGLGQLDHKHPLRKQPFLFAQFPIVNDKPVQVLNWSGIVLVIGNLIAAWGVDDVLTLPRETIRSAQEMGINLLQFAWRRRQLTSREE